MSQAKVDYKKEQRKNIKKTVRKRKISHVIGILVFVLAACGMLGWLGYSGYKTYEKNKSTEASAREEIEVDLDSISDYLESLNPTDEVEETSEEDTDSEEETVEEDSEETAENEASDEE